MRAPLWTVALAVPAAIAAAVVFGPSSVAPAPAPVPTVAVTQATLQEDQPGWSCITGGNRYCGVGNSNGVPAGQYDQAGVLVAPAAATTATGSHGKKACHTAYTVAAHDVPEHQVKATAKHSAYTAFAHTVAAHTVKANC